ncbi:OsmC family protein [Sphingobium boeckii]|nr:OsmC family protein [Sphingobium boeckii]
MAGGHHYRIAVEWTGNQGTGTSGYRDYARDHVIRIAGKPDIPGSSDPAFLGDPARHNPEEMLVASLSACHMLWYLHLCAEAGIAIIGYRDQADGMMAMESDGAGQFSGVVLRPQVTLAADANVEAARALHHEAHAKCFIARSVNFPVTVEPVFQSC